MADIAVPGRPGSLPLGSPVAGHLFTDTGLPGEYDEQAAFVLRERALASCRSPRG